MQFTFTRPDFGAVTVPDDACLGAYAPSESSNARADVGELIEVGMESPIGAPPLEEIARRGQKTVILVDDNTRVTPTASILPGILRRLSRCGIPKKDVRLLVATGTHRAMTIEEKRAKYGDCVCGSYQVVDHEWDNPAAMADLGSTANGTRVIVNKIALEADLLIGVGHIVPHRVPGFGGGGKIVQPGVCGAITTGQTHWLSAQYDSYEIMGKRDNPVRVEIDTVASMVGLDYLFNAVLDRRGRMVRLLAGDFVEAHRVGCRVSESVFGVNVPCEADIVVSEAYPSDLDLWQAVKGLFAADCLVRRGGVIILVAGLEEGVSHQHPVVEATGYHGAREIQSMVDRGELPDMTVAAHLMHVGRIIVDRAKTILVSKGLDRATTEGLGFVYAENAASAICLARDIVGADAKIAFLSNGGEILPIVRQRERIR
ncbi:MAG: nickel-dependent lactate racemase [Firmicutes bacterium]|nr:nickel-dependent lactate racemase [Bacillota bacterium]